MGGETGKVKMIIHRFPKPLVPVWRTNCNTPSWNDSHSKRPINMVEEFKGWSSPLRRFRSQGQSSRAHVSSKMQSTCPLLAWDIFVVSHGLSYPHVAFGSTWSSRSFSSLSLPPWGVDAQPMQGQQDWHWVGTICRLKDYFGTGEIGMLLNQWWNPFFDRT